MSIDPSSLPSFGPANNPSDGSGEQSGPAPVIMPDQDLVKQLLEQMQLKYVVDDDGDLAAPWEGFRVYFMFRGDDDQPNQLYAVRAFYDRAYTIDEKPRLLEALDEWNRDTLWPKVYTHTHDDGVVRVIGETQMVVANGVSLDHFVASTANWINSSIGFEQWLVKQLGLAESADGSEGTEPGEAPGDAES